MMNDTDILIEVAKLDGWTMLRELNRCLIGKPPDEQLHEHYKTAHIPTANGEWQLKPYLTSRDAIIPVIEKIVNSKDEVWNFSVNLSKILTETDEDYQELSPVDYITATPRQLCIALLKATGRWKE